MPKPQPSSTPQEVVPDLSKDKPQRRRFDREEKLRILREADACTERGALGALLRREGIYSSHLTSWRQQLREHGESGLEPQRRGPTPKKDERDARIGGLERRVAKLDKELAIARKVIDLQKKAHEILGIALPGIEDDEARS